MDRKLENSRKLKVHIRWMIRCDMDEVLGIENKCFEYPWSEDDFIRCLRARTVIGMVAENPTDEKVVGFMLYELHKTRLHLLNFAVLPVAQKSCVGTQLVAKLIGKLAEERRVRITLELRETNLAGQLFFRACGFKATKVLRDYFDETVEDAYAMEYSFGGSSQKWTPCYLGLQRRNLNG